MTWLQRRPSGQYRVRVTIPPRLRSFFGDRTILTRVLGTADPQVAKRKAVPVMAELQRQLAEAEAALANPAVAAYKAVQDVQASNLDDDQAEALDSYLTTKLEEDDEGERSLDPAQRATYLAVLNRDQQGAEDNPPLSVVFERWKAERQPPLRTWQEWTTARKRSQAVVGGDVPIRALTRVHLRAFKESLLRTSKRHGSAMLSLASVRKNLAAVRAVLSWAVSQGYLDSSPAGGLKLAGGGTMRDQHSRLPYDADDLARIFSPENRARFARSPADTWLPLLGLWTAARLEELGGLRVEDVKKEAGIPYLFIRATDQRRLKNRGSERRVVLHPALLRAGFLDYVRSQPGPALFPELRPDAGGKLTRMWGKRFARHVRLVCGITDKRKAPHHSLRHAWIDAARAVMEEEHRHTITGHSGGGVGRTYGTSVPLSVLAESMAKVRYEGIV